MKYWERCALYCCVAGIWILVFELSYICDKIFNGWPGGTR